MPHAVQVVNPSKPVALDDQDGDWNLSWSGGALPTPPAEATRSVTSRRTVR
ncbi:hypothetical protein ABT116_23340 [Streptomyces sp. NPDC002130]|uniref:hypothetical protein n=1 Tax=Streptomyces sp. NPDC002130 TaxID=3155568 RepID=UPI003324EC97